MFVRFSWGFPAKGVFGLADATFAAPISLRCSDKFSVIAVSRTDEIISFGYRDYSMVSFFCQRLSLMKI